VRFTTLTRHVAINRSGTLKRAPLRKLSATKARLDRQLAALTRQLIAERGNRCELRVSPYCRGRAEGTHHVLKRSQGGKHEAGNLLLACDPCNSHVEDHPAQALALGLVRRRGGGD
jgi:hypothetical protein